MVRTQRTPEQEPAIDGQGELVAAGTALKPVKLDLESEVLALVQCLRQQFDLLPESLRRYAARVHLNPSVLSRYFSGERVAPRHVVEELLGHVAKHTGADVTQEVREHLYRLQSEALRTRNPLEHQAQTLSDQLADALVRLDQDELHVKVLVAAVTDREQRIRQLVGDMRQLETAWASDRDRSEAAIELHCDRQEQLEDECERLRTEVIDLQNQLGRATKLRKEADTRCAALEGKLAVVQGEIERERLTREAQAEQDREALAAEAERTLWEATEAAKAKRAEAEAHYQDIRASAAAAATDFETKLAKRREETERSLAARQSKAEEHMAEVETRSQEIRVEIEKMRRDAEARAHQTILTAQARSDEIVADARITTDRLREESEYVLAELSRVRSESVHYGSHEVLPVSAAPPAGTSMVDPNAAARVLSLAQRTADLAVAGAREEAAKIVAEAHRRADAMQREAANTKQLGPDLDHREDQGTEKTLSSAAG